MSLRELVEFERRSKQLGLVLHELYMKARDKREAARIRKMLAEGKITYQEAVRELKKLAETRDLASKAFPPSSSVS